MNTPDSFNIVNVAAGMIKLMFTLSSDGLMKNECKVWGSKNVTLRSLTKLKVFETRATVVYGQCPWHDKNPFYLPAGHRPQIHLDCK